jgi:hypothetical protein
MSIGDDGDDDPAWRSVAETLGGRLAEIEEEIETVETETDITDLESRLEAVESDLEESEIPADAEEREEIETAIEELRGALPPAWMPTVWAFEDRLDDIQSDLEAVDSESDVEAVESAVDDLESDLADSDVPEDAAEYESIQSGIDNARESLPGEEQLQVWSFEARLEGVETDIEDAETEADLDEIDAALDEIESDVDSRFPPADEDDEESEESEHRGEVIDEIETLRSAVEDERGPYAEDVVETIESAEETLTGGDWTDQGAADVEPAVAAFLDAAGDALGESFETTGEDPSDLAMSLASVRETVDETDLDPDGDDETIATLLEAATTLEDELDDAEEWGDLTIQQELDRKGFYDVLNPENRKDFPPEWNAIKIYEKQYAEGETEAIEPILLGLEKFESDFMQENVLDSLERIAPEEAFEELHQLAQKRNKQPVRILGRIGDERAAETLQEFIDGGDVALRKVSLRALGAIGSADSVQPVANQLADENDEIRSTAARALGLIGDTRAIDPLADVLADDEADEVRASAAWALNQIGTDRAREAAAEYADDSSYIVQIEAEKARDAAETAA